MRKTRRKNRMTNAQRKRERIAAWREFLKDFGEYDGGYLLKLMRFMMGRMRKHFVECGHMVNEDEKRICSQLKKVERLLERVEDDRYHEELEKKYEFKKKYGRLKMISGKKDEKGNTPVDFKFTKQTPRNKKAADKLWLRIRNEAAEVKVRELDEAFAIIREHIWEWWD